MPHTERRAEVAHAAVLVDKSALCAPARLSDPTGRSCGWPRSGADGGLGRW